MDLIRLIGSFDDAIKVLLIFTTGEVSLFPLVQIILRFMSRDASFVDMFTTIITFISYRHPSVVPVAEILLNFIAGGTLLDTFVHIAQLYSSGDTFLNSVKETLLLLLSGQTTLSEIFGTIYHDWNNGNHT